MGMSHSGPDMPLRITNQVSSYGSPP